VIAPNRGRRGLARKNNRNLQLDSRRHCSRDARRFNGDDLRDLEVLKCSKFPDLDQKLSVQLMIQKAFTLRMSPGSTYPSSRILSRSIFTRRLN
jgi:hypothetical protein